MLMWLLSVASRKISLVFDAQSRITEIDLESVNVVAPLQRRFDKKFLLDEKNLERLVPKLLELEQFDWRVLTIEQEREFLYSTTYFDDNLLTYWDHLKGKRLRFKIRSREYPNNGPVMLEVKTKTGRGMSDKHRLLRDQNSGIQSAESEWVTDCLSACQIRHSGGPFEPALTLSYSRTTLVAVSIGERLTIDRLLSVSQAHQASNGPSNFDLLPDSVVLEVKSNRPRSNISKLLYQNRYHPQSLSKYCLGIAAANNSLDRGMLRAAERQMRRLAAR